MDVSIVIPSYNERESLPELIAWIERTMQEHSLSYEIIVIDDGSADGSWEYLRETGKEKKHLRAIVFARNYGKSPALHYGFGMAEGEVVITMDADLQDSPEEIPDLVRMIQQEGYDLLSGWKKKRYDPISKTLPSKFFNWTARRVTGIMLHDFNCGLKAYRKEVIKSIEVYGEMHRYMPVLVKHAGFHKIGEKVVSHQARKYGRTKFGADRLMKGFLDLLSITFISRFGRKPMHLFGTLGTLMFILGFIGAAYLGINKLVHVSRNLAMERITSSPYFYLALAFMIIGTQLFLAGFIGELITRSSQDRNVYQVKDSVNTDKN